MNKRLIWRILIVGAIIIILITGISIFFYNSNKQVNELPKNFGECMNKGGYTTGINEDSCTFQVSFDDNPKLYKICEGAGGGISADGQGPNFGDSQIKFAICEVVYPKDGKPCFGNFCD